MKQTVFMMSSLYEDEGWIGHLSKVPDVEFIDFRNLEGTQCYCCEESVDSIWDTLSDLNPEGNVRWIDTGDYHYLSAINFLSLDDTDNLILIDNHPDNFAYDGTLSCGNWMSYIDTQKPLVEDKSHPAYISLDLDILSPKYFKTNWDQGNMTLDELFSLILSIAVSTGISDIDICGGLTCSKGASEGDLFLNYCTRLKIQEFLSKLL